MFRHLAFILGWVTAVSFAGAAAGALPPAATAPEWKPIPIEPLAVVPGSALDCARFVEDGPAGRYGRVIVGRDGHLAFERQPEKRIRFFGFSGHGVPECRTKADVDALVAAIRTQGYNLVRPHFLDLFLMGGAREDFAFDPAKLDLFFYYVARLKENGIYLFFDAMTSGNGYRALRDPWTVAPERDLKLAIYHDAAARAHWERGVRQLLTTKNPFTGLTLAEDPVVAVLLFFNEQEVRPGSAAMTRPWQQFLVRKYRTMPALRAAWRDPKMSPTEDAFASVPIYSRDDVYSANANPARAADIAEFLTALTTETLQWYVEKIRAMGYRGLYTQYDFHKSLYLTPIRAALPVVTMHSYHDHPSGNAQTQESALAGAANWWRTVASTRFTGRPFLVTEYGHVFRNRFRYEEGLVVGGYAALQDIDLLMAHQQPVKLTPKPMITFHVGYDPVLRASQFLTGFLFQRGDVAPAPHRVNIAVRAADLANPAVRPLGGMNSEQSRIALITGLGVSSGTFAPWSNTAPVQPDLEIGPAGGAEQVVERLFATAVDRADGSFDLAGFVAEMKKRRVLPPRNRTDPAHGFYESETGELQLDAPARRMTVRTPRLEGIAFDSLESPVALGVFAVESSSVAASVALVAVDDRPLAASKRLVLVYATDALNSGMTFADSDAKQVTRGGELPVLVRTGMLRAKIAHREATRLRVWPLALNGTRRAPISARVADGAIELEIDTARLPDGPATFYELALE